MFVKWRCIKCKKIVWCKPLIGCGFRNSWRNPRNSVKCQSGIMGYIWWEILGWVFCWRHWHNEWEILCWLDGTNAGEWYGPKWVVCDNLRWIIISCHSQRSAFSIQEKQRCLCKHLIMHYMTNSLILGDRTT